MRANSTLQSFGFAFNGVLTAWKDERNFRIQVCYGILVSALLLAFRPPLASVALALLSVTLLLAAELANSSLERVVDLVCPEVHPLAGEAKDMAAGAVMLTSFASAFVVFCVFFSHLTHSSSVGLGGLLLFFQFIRSKGGVIN